MSENDQQSPPEQDPPVMRYRGDGTLRIAGVPLRDLSKADVEALRPEALREAMASNLYEIASGAHLPVNRSAIQEPPEVPQLEGSGQIPLDPNLSEGTVFPSSNDGVVPMNQLDAAGRARRRATAGGS